MKILKLNKQNEPDFKELYEMISGLTDFFNQKPDFDNAEWKINFDIILDFQDEDGSFKLFDSYKIPSDARVDFCYMPTYICSAALMKAFMTCPSSFALRDKLALINGLRNSCARSLRGHGYEGLKGQIEALNIFMKAGLKEFMDLYPGFCPEFTWMIEKIITQFGDMEAEGNFTGSWGESYEDEIRAVNRYFSQRQVFVYGTLMKGEANHHYLDGSTFIGDATIEGYDMYDVWLYPAIVEGDSLIKGELYEVPLKDMSSIDALEGEGSLYAKKCVRVTDASGKTALAFVYVYLGDVEGLRILPSWNEYVWYVAYGSNMHSDRFMCYIEGGSYGGSRHHPACADTSAPAKVKAIEIPYGMYFGNVSGSWHGSGVSFLDVTEKGKSLGVAYLITKEQFEHVLLRENGERPPQEGYDWYEDVIDLGEMDGFEVKTITNKDIRPYNEPTLAYLDTLVKGLKENFPEMSDVEIEDYLDSCIR